MVYVPKPKDGANVQAVLVSDTGGDAVPATPAAAADGDGVPPLGDPFGRFWVNVVGGGPPPPPFNTRVQLATAKTLQASFRQLFASAGMVETLVVSLEFIAARILQSGVGVSGLFVQVHDVIGAPPPLNVPETSTPMRQNRVSLSISMPITVATGAVVVLSSTAETFTALPGVAGPDGFISQGVVFV